MADSWASLQRLPGPIIPLGGWDPLQSYAQATKIANALDQQRDSQITRRNRALRLDQARKQGLITEGQYEGLVNGPPPVQPQWATPEAPQAPAQPNMFETPDYGGYGSVLAQANPYGVASQWPSQAQTGDPKGNPSARPSSRSIPGAIPIPTDISGARAIPIPTDISGAQLRPLQGAPNQFDLIQRGMGGQGFQPGTDDFYGQVGGLQGQQPLQANQAALLQKKMERFSKLADIMHRVGPEGLAAVKPYLVHDFPEVSQIDPSKMKVAGDKVIYEMPNGQSVVSVKTPDGKWSRPTAEASPRAGTARGISQPSGDSTDEARRRDNLWKMQIAEMAKAQSLESVPGAGVWYWNHNGALSRLGHLTMREENGPRVYRLNGRPVAFGSQGADNAGAVRPVQQPAPAPKGAKAGADPNKIERSVPRRLWSGLKNDLRDMGHALVHPVETAEGALVFGLAPIAALNKDPVELDLDSPSLPRRPVGRGRAPEVPPEYLKAPEELRRRFDAAWNAQKDFVSQNVKDPAGIPKRALNYGIDHPLNTALMASGALGAGGKVAEAGNLARTARILNKASEYSNPLTPAKWAAKRAAGHLADMRGMPEEENFRNSGKGVAGTPPPQSIARPGSGTIVTSNARELNGLRYEDAITRLYDSALNPKDNSQKWISVGRVSEENVRRVSEAGAKAGVDIDVSGYTRTIDNYSIRHIHGHHGDPVTEGKRGQIAVTKEDIARIPEIVETPDQITYEGKRERGGEVMLYKKKIDGTVYYFEEVRTGRRTVNATTLWKRKAGTSNAK